MANDFLETMNTYLCEIFAHLLSQESKVVHHIFGTTLEMLTQLRILGSHAHRTGVGIALAHHHTTQHNERQRTKRELVGSQHRHNDDVFGSLQLAISLEAHLIAKSVHHQCLLCFGQSYLGRDTCEAH